MEIWENKYVECDSFSLQCFNTLSWATGRASDLYTVGCWFVGGDVLIMTQYNKPKKVINTLRPGLYGDDPLTTVRLPQRSLSSQSLGKCQQLNQNNQKRELIPT